MEKFTVRPAPLTGESLSSYLLRACRENAVKYTDVKPIIEKNIKLGAAYGYKLDLIPNYAVNLQALSNLTGLSNEQIEKMTFSPIGRKLFDDVNENYDLFRVSLYKEVEKNKRRFCIECMKEKGVYKLIWQVKQINLCDKHLTPLTSCCPVCGHEQPYITDSQSIFACCKCNSSLINNTKTECLTDEEIIHKETREYENWNFLLNSLQPLTIQIEGLTKEKSLAIQLLYVAQGQKEHLKWSEIKVLSRSQIRGLTAFIKGRNSPKAKKVSLQDLFKVASHLGLTIEEFTQIKVPSSYLRSIFVGTKDLQPGPCFAPWCESYQSNRTMVKLETKETNNRKNKYQMPSICTKCFTKYGYSRASGKWEEIGDKTTFMWGAVLPLLKAGHSFTEIKKITNCNNHKLYENIGYIAYHSLAPSAITEHYVPKNIPEYLLESFMELYKAARDYQSMCKNAKQKFGWKTPEFYYYLASKEVQEYLQLSPETNKRRSFKTLEWSQKVDKVLKYLIDNDIQPSLKEVAATLECDERVLKYHKLDHLIKKAAEQQREKSLDEQERILWQKVKRFVEDMLIKVKKYSVEDVYKSIGATRKFVRKNFPDMAKWISNQTKLQKDRINEKRIKDWCERAREAYKELYLSGRGTSNKQIAMKMGVSLNVIDQNPEVRKAIQEAKLEFGFVQVRRHCLVTPEEHD